MKETKPQSRKIAKTMDKPKKRQVTKSSLREVKRRSNPDRKEEKVLLNKTNRLTTEKKSTRLKITSKAKTPSTNSILVKKIKPYMDFLGIKNFNAFCINYYEGLNEVYVIETDYLETFVLKIFNKSAYKLSASIEKHFITNCRSVSKLTPKVCVSHDGDKNISQFLFSDRMAGANKKWKDIDTDSKEKVLSEIAKTIFKIHTYDSKKILKEELYGLVDKPEKSWTEYLQKQIDEKILQMRSKKILANEIFKFQKMCESHITKIALQRIKSTLLHGSFGLNEQGFIRSILFVGNSISAVLNSEKSIYGDKMWDLVGISQDILNKKSDMEKIFFHQYGKLKDEERERLEFYLKLIA